MGFVTPLVTAFGGQWFDSQWRTRDRHARVAPAHHAGTATGCASSARPARPPTASTRTLALFAGGRCGMWIDATVAAGLLYDPKQSQVSDRVGFAPCRPATSPAGRPGCGAGTWRSPHLEAAGGGARLRPWARPRSTSSSCAGERLGGGAAGHAAVHLRQLRSTRRPRPSRPSCCGRSTTPTRPPARASRGPTAARNSWRSRSSRASARRSGQTVAATLTGQNVEQALRSAQSATERAMRQAGYPK
jgi:sorbitol/mannitol transport system substrate-binding protein